MQHIEFGWQTGGIAICGKGWQPEGDPAAAVCLVHGLGEHTGRYAHVAAALTAAGYALLGFDLCGHGESSGQRGDITGIDAWMDDITHLLDEAAARFPGKSRFLYGHSLGGSLVLNYALRRRPDLAGVIASAPLIRTPSPISAPKLALGKVMYRLWPTFAMANGLERAALSRDPEVVRAYGADPLVHDRISARSGMELLELGPWALEHASEFNLPLLLMHGTADRITSAAASREFAAKVPGDCTLRLWDGLYHEIHNEPEKKEVLAFMIDWLQKHTPAC